MDLKAFILRHQKYMTVSDIVDETGQPAHVVRQLFKTLRITPVKQGQVIRNYIMEMYKRKSKAQIAKALNVTVGYLDKVYTTYGIIEPDFTPVTRKTISQTLGEVTTNDLGTYERTMANVMDDLLNKYGYERAKGTI
jgi:hypothetical protein